MPPTNTERMREISRLDREIDALKRPPRTVIPFRKPEPIPAIDRLLDERKGHVRAIQRSE